MSEIEKILLQHIEYFLPPSAAEVRVLAYYLNEYLESQYRGPGRPPHDLLTVWCPQIPSWMGNEIISSVLKSDRYKVVYGEMPEKYTVIFGSLNALEMNSETLEQLLKCLYYNDKPYALLIFVNDLDKLKEIDTRYYQDNSFIFLKELSQMPKQRGIRHYISNKCILGYKLETKKNLIFEKLE